MRSAVFVIVVAACGGGASDPVTVDQLDANAQVELCEQFLDDLCVDTADPDLISFCTDRCINDACQPAAEVGLIDDHCTSIEIAAVEECAASGDLAVCEGAGGCMIVALQVGCAGT